MSIPDLSKYIPATPEEISDFKIRQEVLLKPYTPVVGEEEKELDDDFEESRKRLAVASRLAEEAAREAMELAKSSDHPRAWEVVGNLIKTLADVNQSLVQNHHVKAKAKKDMIEKQDAPTTQTNTQNNYFMGSSSEMAEFVRKQIGGKDETD